MGTLLNQNFEFALSSLEYSFNDDYVKCKDSLQVNEKCSMSTELTYAVDQHSVLLKWTVKNYEFAEFLNAELLMDLTRLKTKFTVEILDPNFV